MNDFYPSVVIAPPSVAEAFDSISTQPRAIDTFEQFARDGSLNNLPYLQSKSWEEFSSEVRAAFAERDHVVLKGLPVSADGVTLLLAAQTVGVSFRIYRDNQIVKHFKMSPWTTELSHTTREGEFHTDLNTEPLPPAVTAMQCLDPDPGAPGYGANRVARLTDLRDYLLERDSDTLEVLTKHTLTMLNDHASASWSGHVIDNDMIRYHPETLRAAIRRDGLLNPTIDTSMSGVTKAAFAVSNSFNMDSGDVLLLSNHRTLHYRGHCSVVFRNFPTEFDSRSIFVLHMSQELKN